MALSVRDYSASARSGRTDHEFNSLRRADLSGSSIARNCAEERDGDGRGVM